MPTRMSQRKSRRMRRNNPAQPHSLMPSSPASSPDSASPAPEYADVAPGDLIQVGFVYRAHGMDGELKINPEHTDDPTRFEELETVYLGTSPHVVTRHVISTVRYQESKRGTSVILGLESVDSRTAAEEVVKKKVFAREEDLELAEDEIFVHDLVGLVVVSEDGERFGTVANYVEMPAHDVFVIRRSGQEDAMIPAVEDFIVEVDLDGGRLVVRPIDGLLE